MRQLKAYTVALLAICALGLIASQSALALALPEFTLLAGEKFPVTGEGVSRVDPNGVKFETGAALKIIAEQAAAFLEISSAGPSGTLLLLFINVKEGKATCSSLGEKEGAIKLKGELRLVPTSKEASQLGALVTFTETSITCKEGGKEVLKDKLKAPVIAKVVATVASKGEEVTSFGLVAKCSGIGKQELTSYLNDEEKAVEKQLPEIGEGTGCLEFKDELPIFLSKKVEMPTTLVNTSLPYLQILPASEKYPVLVEGSAKTEVKVESPGKFGFSATEVKFTLEAAKVGPSGPLTLRFTGAKDKSFPLSCSTEGAAAGEVLVDAEYRTVFTSLLPLTVGLLVTFPKLIVKCVMNFEMNSPLLLGVKATLKEAITSIGVPAKCSAEVGKQELTAYFNDEKKLIEKQLMLWQRNELPFEYACFSTGAENTLSGKKKFIVVG